MQTNFRRELKNLRKDVQRGVVSNQGVMEWFQGRGFFTNGYGLVKINNILSTDIPSRIWARIGRAAKKKGAFALIERMVSARDYGKGFHEIPFVTVEREMKYKTQCWEEVRVIDDNGTLLLKQRFFIN